MIVVFNYVEILYNEAKEKNKYFLENSNFIRLAEIIAGPLTGILQAVLRKEIRPNELSKIVKELCSKSKSRRLLFTEEQEVLIYSGDYSKFDIVLLYFSLRNVCAIPSHANKWGNRPNPADKSVSANIERIRLIRNQFAHTSEFSISDENFNEKCLEVFNIVQELEQYLGTSTVFCHKVQNIISRDSHLNEMVHSVLGNSPSYTLSQDIHAAYFPIFFDIYKS